MRIINKKAFLSPILDPGRNQDRLLKEVSSLIDFHSIMVDIHQEDDYCNRFSENFLDSQISHGLCLQFSMQLMG
jgi:hypothetical protein